MNIKNMWEIILSVLFPGIGQIVYGRFHIGVTLLVLNGLTLYILWIILMPLGLGILLHDRREQHGDIEGTDTNLY